MIPEFPHFKKLELSDKEDVEKFILAGLFLLVHCHAFKL